MIKRIGFNSLMFALTSGAVFLVSGMSLSRPPLVIQEDDRPVTVPFKAGRRAVAGTDVPPATFTAHPPSDQASITKNYKAIDAHALATPPSKEINIPTLAAYLVAPAKNELEKARAISRWMADRIVYDEEGYNKGLYGKANANEVLTDRIGVCHDFATLFVALAKAARLEAIYISGLSKGYGYTEGGSMKGSDHAWNAFKADGKWHLVDVTWMEGYGANIGGKLQCTKKFDPNWFDPSPSAFVLSHLPKDPQWQLLDKPLTQAELEKMPKVDLELFRIGFKPEAVLAGLRALPMVEPPFTSIAGAQIQNFQGPCNKFVKIGEPIEFSFVSSRCVNALVEQDFEWFPFQREGNVWKLRFVPKPGKFSLLFSETEGWSQIFMEYIAKRVVGLAG